jgi:hypothetical protein
MNRRPGFDYDGKLILTEESRPAQIPYRSLLPQGVDNLLVPVCLSATHVAWGAVRLEPVFMQVGEAAGVAAALSVKNQTTPGELASEKLSRELCSRKFMVAFFNDIDASSDDSQVNAAEYFGTRGFFADYDARLGAPLKTATAAAWIDGLAQLRAGRLQPNELALNVAEAEQTTETIDAQTFASQAKLSLDAKEKASSPITRGAALRMMWQRVIAE